MTAASWPSEIVHLHTEVSRLKAALKAITDANDWFRSELPDDWESDPVNDACEAAKSLLSSAEQKP